MSVIQPVAWKPRQSAKTFESTSAIPRGGFSLNNMQDIAVKTPKPGDTYYIAIY